MHRMAPLSINSYGQTRLVSEFIKPSKRNRDDFQSDQIDHEESMREVKHSRLLPIRASLLRPSRPTVFPPKQLFMSTNSQILTPAGSDDELFDDEARRLSTSTAPEQDNSQTNSSSRVPHIRVQTSEDDDAMDMIYLPPSAITFPVLSPPVDQQYHAKDSFPQAPGYLRRPSRDSSDRLPTPIRSTFRSSSDTEMSGISGGSLPMLRTILSPMIGSDTPRTGGLPSPDSEYDPDQMELSPVKRTKGTPNNIEVDHYLSTPSFASPTPLQLQSSRSPFPQGFNGQNEPPNPRVPRLHMGYRADCQKCVQRVPGHYSHILWS